MRMRSPAPPLLMIMKAAFFEVEEWEKGHLVDELQNFEVSFFTEKLTAETAAQAKDCQIISVFTDSQITKEIIESLPDLKLIATRSTSFDHIDLPAAKARGITVCNVPTYGENTVAEHTFALILDLSRKVHQSIEGVKKEGFAIKGLRGFDLKGKTIGVVGLGHIGQHVARIANGFEMRVLGFDVKQDKKLAKGLGFSYATLEELLEKSDIVTLHVPLNEHTRHLINVKNIGLLKKGAYIINTARGGLIETGALVKALDDGMIAGAGLDVLEEECYIKEERELLSGQLPKTCDISVLLQNHVLMERENVVITPHNAFNSVEALERILQTTVENIKGFEEGKLVNIIQ